MKRAKKKPAPARKPRPKPKKPSKEKRAVKHYPRKPAPVKPPKDVPVPPPAAPEAAPVPVVVEPPKPSSAARDFKAAQDALQAYWGTGGFHNGAGVAADACRKLDKGQLELLAAWVPKGTGLTEQRCTRAREIVEAVIAEKQRG